MILLLFLYGTKSRENNGPNGQPAQCMTPSEFYKKKEQYIGIGQRLIVFCVYVSVVVRQCCRPRLIKLAKIWKPLLLLLRLRVRQGRCCVDLL